MNEITLFVKQPPPITITKKNTTKNTIDKYYSSSFLKTYFAISNK